MSFLLHLAHACMLALLWVSSMMFIGILCMCPFPWGRSCLRFQDVSSTLLDPWFLLRIALFFLFASMTFFMIACCSCASSHSMIPSPTCILHDSHSWLLLRLAPMPYCYAMLFLHGAVSKYGSRSCSHWECDRRFGYTSWRVRGASQVLVRSLTSGYRQVVWLSISQDKQKSAIDHFLCTLSVSIIELWDCAECAAIKSPSEFRHMYQEICKVIACARSSYFDSLFYLRRCAHAQGRLALELALPGTSQTCTGTNIHIHMYVMSII